MLILPGLYHLVPAHAAAIQYVARHAPTFATDSLRASRAVPTWAFWLQQSWAGAELLALLFAAYQLWARRSERRRAEAEAAALAVKAANYQAWSVVNSAQGKGGSGGRIDALQDLSRNGVSLAGVRLDGAWLQGIALPGAKLNQASMRETNLTGANLADANLEGADLADANLTGADLRGTFLKGANVAGTHLGTADLRGADLDDLRGWKELRSVTYLQIADVRHAPAGFCQWALEHGAIDGDAAPAETDSEEPQHQDYSAQFRAV